MKTDKTEIVGDTAAYTLACEAVWKKLSSVNCNEHVEKKNGLSFLSWAWAYQTIMEHYPNFEYQFQDSETFADGTVMINVFVCVCHGDVEVGRKMWLPVMDYRNKAIVNPDAMARNTAKMRCLTKAISMLGLGAYIYAGEDLPQDAGEPEPVSKTAAKKPAAKKVAAKKPAAEKPEEVDDDELVIENELGAVYVANQMITLAKEMHAGSVRSLADFWKKNKKIIDKLHADYPEDFERVKAAFTILKDNANGAG